MAGLQDALLNSFANELCHEADGKEVWAFIATYDKNGEFAWKGLGFNDEGEDIVLGSDKVTFGSVTD